MTMNYFLNAGRNFIKASVLLMSFLFGFWNGAYAWDYGNGRHGSYTLTGSTTIEQLYQAVRLTNDPVQYNPADSNAIPNFQNLLIANGATLSANSWNGTSGGQIVLKVQATLTVAQGGSITVKGLGYRGGGGSQQGESYAGSQTSSGSANYGGGGGGVPNGNSINPAGGGGYGSPGNAGNYYGVGGAGGAPYGTPSLDTVYMGSGGGGAAASSGNGGGAIALNVGYLQVDGSILANGNNGQSATGFYYTGGGGGGSGGSILLRVASANLGTANVYATGGGGGNYAGNGGSGRISVEYAEEVTGMTAPEAYTNQDASSDNATIIINQPVSQTNYLGSNMVFSVNVTGISPFTYQWYFNNAAVVGATNSALPLVSLSFTNQGVYYVTVSNILMSVVSSNALLTIFDPRTPFNDGIPNWWKEEYGLSTNDPTLATNYPSADNQLTYFEKYLYGLSPLTNDTDGDGLTDYAEIFIYHTNPLLANTSGDGIPDGWKVEHGLNPVNADAGNIAGFDGVTYMQVYQYDLTHTNQLNPNSPFAVGTGLSNYELINNGQHTNSYYYDQEDRLEGAEYSRGISIGYSYDGNGNILRQTVLSRSAETNGLPVLWLWLNGLTNQPGVAYQSSSGNGWDNYQEWLAGLNPNSNSIPSLLNNPGTNIASPSFPFTPSNFVEATGGLNGAVGDVIVVGADGNPGTNSNFIIILSQNINNWSTQQVNIGNFGVTSIAIGQPANRPTQNIYLGLRQSGGHGSIIELSPNGANWQSAHIMASTDEAAYVLGVRGTNDVLVSFSTNVLTNALFSLGCLSNQWTANILSTNSSHQGLGTQALVPSRIIRDASLRLIDAGDIELIGGNLELLVGGYQIPSNSVYYSGSGKWYFQTPTAMEWPDAEKYSQSLGGNLVTIQNGGENSFILQNVPNMPAWIGAFGDAWTSPSSPGPIGWASGESDGYADYVNCGLNPIWSYAIQLSANYAAYIGTNGPCGGTGWYSSVQTSDFFGIGETVGTSAYFTNRWLLPETSNAQVLNWRGENLASGSARAALTNATSIFRCFIEDANSNGIVDVNDSYDLVEYVLAGNFWTTNTIFQIPIASGPVAQCYGLAAVNFTGTGSDTLFTGEPDGRVFSWTGTDATSPLERQLFSDAYVGDAWQAMCSVQMPGFGSGLAGLLVSPTNQNTCNVIFWAPQAVLPTPQPSVLEIAPYAAVIPSVSSLGSNAVVTVRLWHDEGDASTPFLQFQILGSTNWQNATLTALDDLPFNSSTLVAALPTGSDHLVTWNALADIGANIFTNILLRASARDFMLTGSWSLPTPFLLNTSITTTPNSTNSPVSFTGITQIHGGVQFSWQGSTNEVMFLQRSPTLTGTNVNWVNIWTGSPPTLFFGSYTDYFGTNPQGFYRFKLGNQ